jgi:hypothetical protein
MRVLYVSWATETNLFRVRKGGWVFYQVFCEIVAMLFTNIFFQPPWRGSSPNLWLVTSRCLCHTPKSHIKKSIIFSDLDCRPATLSDEPRNCGWVGTWDFMRFQVRQINVAKRGVGRTRSAPRFKVVIAKLEQSNILALNIKTRQPISEEITDPRPGITRIINFSISISCDFWICVGSVSPIQTHGLKVRVFHCPRSRAEYMASILSSVPCEMIIMTLTCILHNTIFGHVLDLELNIRRPFWAPCRVKWLSWLLLTCILVDTYTIQFLDVMHLHLHRYQISMCCAFNSIQFFSSSFILLLFDLYTVRSSAPVRGTILSRLTVSIRAR